MQEKKALISRCRGSLVVVQELRRQCGVSHEVRRGPQGASREVPGKLSLHARGYWERFIDLETW